MRKFDLGPAQELLNESRYGKKSWAIMKELRQEVERLKEDRDDYRKIAMDQELEVADLKMANVVMLAALEIAWGVIGTAGHCRDSEDADDWLKAANRWRERYNIIMRKL